MVRTRAVRGSWSVAGAIGISVLNIGAKIALNPYFRWRGNKKALPEGRALLIVVEH
jgi:hypothetical protein